MTQTHQTFKSMPDTDSDDSEIVIGPREQLFHLIAEASEIEHTLMCSYLYAAFSLKEGTQGTGLSATEAETVARWRKLILAVAVDEMVHLVLVSNLSIALGGRPHFDRPNFPVAAGYFPSGVVVKLTPFSPETLEHFVFLERPQGVKLPDGDGFEHEQSYEREEAYNGLMPSVQDYSTVGRLYEALRVNLVASARRLGEDALFVGPIAGQVGLEAVNLEGVMTIADLSSAVCAIEKIVEQGEGSPTDREDSHYQRFLVIQREYAALRAANPDFAPAWPAAENPVMRRPPEPEGKVFIDDPKAARVLDFANATYGMLLRFLVQAFGRSGKNAQAEQALHLGCAIDLMHVLGRASSALAQMPASAEQPRTHAGMSFTMLRSVEPLFAGPAERQLIHERLRELVGGARVAARANASLQGLDGKIQKIAERFR